MDNTRVICAAALGCLCSVSNVTGCLHTIVDILLTMLIVDLLLTGLNVH